MPTPEHPRDGDDRRIGRRSGYFPLVPGLLFDPLLTELTWKQKFLFIALLTHAWRGGDRNGRLAHGQVIRPLPEIAVSLGIRPDKIQADIRRMASVGLLELDGRRVIVLDYEHWYRWAGPSDDSSVDRQDGSSLPQNGNPLTQNGGPDTQNGGLDTQIGVENTQNGLAEVPSAQQAQGFVPSVRRCSDVISDVSSDVSSSDVLVSAVAATVTSTAGDDDRVDHGTDSDCNPNGNGNGNDRPSSHGPKSSSPSGLRGKPERSEGAGRGHPAASSPSVNDPAGDEQVEDLLERAGLTPSQARRYRGSITPDEARDMIGIFTRYYLDKRLPEKVVPCVVSALAKGREHVQAVIRGSRAQPGYRRVEPGVGSTAGEPRRAETAEGIGRSRADNRSKRPALGELAGRL